MELTLSEVRVGQVRSLAIVGHDIRERKREEARLRQLAEQDSLTGLVNRVSFEHALTRHVEYAARYGSGGSVIALGIDNFKYVNESLGAGAGDEVLAGLAELIAGRLRKTDVFGRVGGDVFGILIHGADRTKALSRRGGAARHRPPPRLRPQRRGHPDHDERRSHLARRARRSSAPSSWRRRRRPCPRRRRPAATGCSPYDPSGRSEVDERRAWTERVRQATERGLFVLTSQPIVDLAKRRGDPARDPPPHARRRRRPGRAGRLPGDRGALRPDRRHRPLGDPAGDPADRGPQQGGAGADPRGEPLRQDDGRRRASPTR